MELHTEFSLAGSIELKCIITQELRFSFLVIDDAGDEWLIRKAEILNDDVQEYGEGSDVELEIPLQYAQERGLA